MLALTQTTPGPDNLSVSNQSYHAFLRFGTSKFFKTKKNYKSKMMRLFLSFPNMNKNARGDGEVGESPNMAERI